MHVAHQDQLAFHLTGRCSFGSLTPIGGRGLLPALLAPYRDLAAVRHDFPLVLSEGAPAASLGGLLDAAVADAGEDAAGQRLRGHARRLERALRQVAAEGGGPTLAAAWEVAAARLASDEPGLSEDLDRLRRALPRDGLLAECDQALPAQLVRHDWTEVQRARSERLRTAIGTLAAGLENILKADFAASPAANSPERLRAGMGETYHAVFDFAAMARLLERGRKPGGLEEGRRRRIEWLLGVLRGQRFAPLPGSAVDAYGFAFEDCAAALEAWRQRLPEAAELARALAMARLEVAGEYDESWHDAIFAAVGAEVHAPSAEFPDYLIVLGEAAAREQAGLVLQAFAAGLPFKVLVQRDDLLETGAGLGLGADALAPGAMSLGEVYVLQAVAAHLFGQRGRLLAALEFAGPALISAFSGAGPGTAGLAPYLVSAAAAESRAFPGFVYDPAAGADWASRFRLDPNPQPQAGWPLHPLNWEDAAHHRQGETVAFTVVDFLACDRRASSHFAVVARDAWNEQLVPLAAVLEPPGAEDRVPMLFMADADGALYKVIADEALLITARRCLLRWRSLQELGGIGNSHAARAVTAARAEWERTASPSPAPVAPATEVAAAPAEPEPAERDPSVAYIETPRCSSCNECIQINDRMFGYDANKQASIIDAKAGTYRQLVEAAEGCQVSVIHPGKPLDPNEPGLEELLQRAEPFL
jgi:hypothetical protein